MCGRDAAAAIANATCGYGSGVGAVMRPGKEERW
jgi:hypothetical protein